MVFLAVGLIIGAGVTFVAFSPGTTTTTTSHQTVTTTSNQSTATTTASEQTITTTTVLTLVLVPVIHTQVETISNLITVVETLTNTFTETSLTTASSPFATIPITYLFVNGSTSAEGVSIPAGVLDVSISSNKTVNFEIMNSALYTKFITGKSVSMCLSTSCNLDQNGAKVGVKSGSIYFQITTPGTYYVWVDNDYSGNSSAAVSASLGMVSQQTATYVVTSTSLTNATTTTQTVTTSSSTTYSTSTVG